MSSPTSHYSQLSQFSQPSQPSQLSQSSQPSQFSQLSQLSQPSQNSQFSQFSQPARWRRCPPSVAKIAFFCQRGLPRPSFLYDLTQTGVRAYSLMAQ